MKDSNFRQRLTELMQKNNLRQADIVKRTGLDKSTVSYYLNGKREPAQDNIFIISQAYDVDPAWLMGYDVPMKKPIVMDLQNFSDGIAAEMIKERDYNFLGTWHISNNRITPEVKAFIDDYLKLTPEQQASVANLVQSMLPDKRLQQAP